MPVSVALQLAQMANLYYTETLTHSLWMIVTGTLNREAENADNVIRSSRRW